MVVVDSEPAGRQLQGVRLLQPAVAVAVVAVETTGVRLMLGTMTGWAADAQPVRMMARVSVMRARVTVIGVVLGVFRG